jgi:hypothetical protein
LKNIIEEYGSIVIALFVGILILAAFFRLTDGGLTGIMVSATELITTQTGNCLIEEGGNPSFDNYRANGRIRVNYTNVSAVAGVMSPVSSHFTANSETGEKVSVVLRAVYDSDNVRFYTQIRQGKEYLYLEHPGIYRVYYEAVDALGRRQYGTLQIPVQRK